MSGRELDPDGTDSYHPEHPWEQVGHPLYIPEPRRTKSNWPPLSDARPAGQWEANSWARMPDGPLPRMHWEEGSGIGIGRKPTVPDGSVELHGLYIPWAKYAEVAGDLAIAESVREQERRRVERIVEIASQIIIQADISNDVKYGTLSAGPIKERMQEIVRLAHPEGA